MVLSVEQSFKIKTRIQKLLLRNALASFARRNTGEPDLVRASKDLLADRTLFDEYYGAIVGIYCTEVDPTAAVGFDEESGTPILDKLIEFMKWMYESGFLELLLKLFFGITLSDEDLEDLDREVGVAVVADVLYEKQVLRAMQQ